MKLRLSKKTVEEILAKRAVVHFHRTGRAVVKDQAGNTVFDGSAKKLNKIVGGR